jgi:hypothetical protein
MKKYKPPKGTGPLGGSRTPPGREGGPPGGGAPSGGRGGPPGEGGFPEGGGSPGGGGSLVEGGPPAKGNLPGAGQQPSDKTWGSLPNHFNGTRSKADDFINELKAIFE